MQQDMANRTANRRSKQPTFFWQGLLIVLPVVVLAAVGLASLRQDKILAQHEATEKAKAIAEKIWLKESGANSPLRKIPTGTTHSGLARMENYFTLRR